MDWLDEAVRGAAPRALGAEQAAAEQAEAVARAVVAGSRGGAGVSRFRRFITGAALGISVLGLGVTAATAGPAVIDSAGWTPDVVSQRSFSFNDGFKLGLCEVVFSAQPDYTRDVSDEEADRRTEEARKFLTEHDWEPLIASITEGEIRAAFEEEVAQRALVLPEGNTQFPATMSIAATQLMADRVGAEFERAGYLRDGVSLAAAAGPCDGETEGATQ